MFQRTLNSLEACFSSPLPSPTTPQAAAALETLWRARTRDQAQLLEYTSHRLRWLGHDAPEAWLLEAAFGALAAKLDRVALDRESIVGLLTLVANLLTLHDPVGRAWKIDRAGERGAVLKAQAHIQQGTYALACAPDAQRLTYSAPSLALWWRAPGAVWRYEAPGLPPQGGRLASGALLTRALLGSAALARARPAQHAA